MRGIRVWCSPYPGRLSARSVAHAEWAWWERVWLVMTAEDEYTDAVPIFSVEKERNAAVALQRVLGRDE